MKEPCVVGVDPGKSGFICRLTAGSEAEFWQMPTLSPKKGKAQYDVPAMMSIFRRIAEGWDVRLVAVEAQQAYPRQGGTSNFSTGYGYGLLHGIAAALGLPVESPHPRTWQKDLCSDLPGDPKLRSILAAGRLFPGLCLKRTAGCRGPDHHKCDALLLAEWARRKMTGLSIIT